MGSNECMSFKKCMAWLNACHLPQDIHTLIECAKGRKPICQILLPPPKCNERAKTASFMWQLTVFIVVDRYLYCNTSSTAIALQLFYKPPNRTRTRLNILIFSGRKDPGLRKYGGAVGRAYDNGLRIYKRVPATV